MLCFTIRTFLVFLTVLSVGAEHLVKEVNSELTTAAPNTAIPIVLQLSTTISSDDMKKEEHHVVQKNIDSNPNVNDIEIFDDKLGPHLAKQEEEEAEAEPEAEPEGEVAEENEAKDEEGEPETEPDAADEAQPDPEPEPEPEKEEEPVEAEEAPAEAPADVETAAETANEEPAAEAEPETKPDVEAEEAAAGNADSDMPNDEPSKDDENNAEETTVAIATDNNDKNEISCFTCTSNDDLKCHKSPTQQTSCPKGNESEKGNKHGCYTLYETDTNITMRGCVDELAEEGLKYCLTNEKFCELCYKTGCNNKTAPSLGNMLQINICLLLTTMMSLIVIRKWI